MITKMTMLATLQTVAYTQLLVDLRRTSETDPEECISLLQHHVDVRPTYDGGLIAARNSRSMVSLKASTTHSLLISNQSTLAAADSVSLLSEGFSKVWVDQYNWPDHIFGHPRQRHHAGMWAQHDQHDWFVLLAFIVVMILIEIFVIRPWFSTTSKTGFSRTGPVMLCWCFAALLFNLYIGARHGYMDAVKWMNGYLLEWMLSMDNIFVFHLVFKLYKTPACLHPKALFWGIIGAILFRMLFFVALNSLLEVMHLCRYVFGLFLVFSGFQALKADDDDDDMAGSWPVRFLSWLLNDKLLPAPHYEMHGRLWVTSQKDGEIMVQISMLVPVIICLELTDILFAVDSVSAKVGQIPDQFVAYSSSVFAMFGLRCLFFVMEDLVNKLRFLKYGLCFILVFIGVELLLADFIELPATVVCIVLVIVFVVCGMLSALFPETQDDKGDNDEPEKTPATY
eukprot:gnl/MRDRNA2_/MRDRNA2_35254_c0_seq1.p1 gnl/MRDRNA2_/MRDRNA2_35254_c0~~gnl/MRDRNA2_/MRDRNA2_35254_c0_seq1.p1  ORF type:complete len:453 (+),score=56.60 gnl/MRDRNA2_/MRDRNA2_35254_c0_seq1:115-1473(+)